MIVVKPHSRVSADRGAILLLDDTPPSRNARADHLVRRGFQVKLASGVSEAESLWQPDHFTLVLVAVRKNLRAAVEFCDRIKGEHPPQTIGLLVPASAELPATRCPDLIWPEDGLDYFLARVDTLADFAGAV
jgi:DNA-binding NtrC family response regulator